MLLWLWLLSTQSLEYPSIPKDLSAIAEGSSTKVSSEDFMRTTPNRLGPRLSSLWGEMVGQVFGTRQPFQGQASQMGAEGGQE